MCRVGFISVVGEDSLSRGGDSPQLAQTEPIVTSIRHISPDDRIDDKQDYEIRPL